ncbi:glycosyl transferase, putative [Pyrobaculum aerophilum str. IM2]|uniref:Glycosyl transferase, putative n=2 Tax=Pyrobaculum aerophilum TaxID=13773 RepID=Q8ZZ63_PYRAE|nr:glycosyltransferase family 2 protein [Pyrobaculum aerophilum]AAL62778.1 glycosyl transferase, putative [Pyrobaculum aerophilum str. IM2]HII46875.1 glycosyltransferase family 2 protein [Pyrobaculum aerophilum]
MFFELGLALAALHFGVPLGYYAVAKRWLRKDWGIKEDGGYRPKISVIIPTYNEAEHIAQRLENVAQSYPRDKLEVVVVDGASTDGTAEIAEKWAEKAGVDVKVVREERREGKAKSLNRALGLATGEVVVIADADALWAPDALRRAVAKLADPSVGAVSCVKRPIGGPGIEEGYRGFYNALRVAESKAWSTPIFHGELAAFKREALEAVGGFPTDIGADDSHTATLIALRGLRAIVADDVLCVETVPEEGYHAWRIRRAQHLIQHFAKAVPLLRKAPRPFRAVLAAEAYLHLVNPWMFAGAVAALTVSAAAGSWPALAALALGVALLAYKPYKTWATAQAYLMAAAVKNLRTKELVWEKQKKNTKQ